MLKKYVYCLLVALMFTMAACQGNDPEESTSVETNTGDDENDFVEKQTWDTTISITWSGAEATVTGSAEGVTISNTNGYVAVTSTAKHVEYVLSGNGVGQLTIYSDYKLLLSLNGLTLACTDGPAVNNQCHKTCYVVLANDNTLTDGTAYASSDEDRKATIFSEGQLIFSGTGSLNVTGNYKHAVCSDDYVRIREGNLTLACSVSDALHSNDGIIINGGDIQLTAANDGIQCDTSSIVVTGGNIAVSSAGDKGILAYGNIEISGGNISINSVGKGIKTQGDLLVSDGVITVTASSSAANRVATAGPGGGGQPGGPGSNGGQAGGDMNSSSGPEGIEAKGTITITGGQVYACAEDDAVNSGGDMTISGGYVCAYSTGNDGLDANGNCYIKGGLVYAIGASSPEVGIDANSEERKQLYVQGGTMVVIGGLESGASISQTCYSASSWSSNTWYALYNGTNIVMAFKTPASGGSGLVVSTASTPSLTSGVTLSGGTPIFNGMASVNPAVSGGTTVSLSSYSGGNTMGGGPGGR